MEHKTVIRERRRGPRTTKPVECVILTEDSDGNLKGKTKDLSCVGANCKFNKHIPEMTRLRLTLELEEGNQTFEGMVVRCDKIKDNHFETAIYFTNIDLAARKSIDQFVRGKKSSNIQEFTIDG